MNKKIIKRIFLIIIFTAVLLGCAKEDVKTFPPFDKNTAPEDCAVLIIPSNVAVHRIDGKYRSRFSSWYTFTKAAALLVPAGERTFIFEYSSLREGRKIENLNYTITMDKEKMYMISVILDEKKNSNVFSSAINAATSFARDIIIDNFPFIDLLPKSSQDLSGIEYQIIETDQPTFDQYLLDSEKRTSANILLLGILAGIVWYLLIFTVLRLIMHLWFMGYLKNTYPVIALIIAICSVVTGIILINYNNTGNYFYYLAATILFGISISYIDMGSASNRRGLAALENTNVEYDNSATLDDLIQEASSKKFNNNYEKAVFHFSKAIEVSPYNAAYVTNRGIAYYRLQNWEKALNDFSRALELKPKNKQYKKNHDDLLAAQRNSWGLSKLKNKDYNEALHHFKKAVFFSPNNPILIFNRGVAYSNLQDWENAISDFTKALELDPNNKVYKENLASAQSQAQTAKKNPYNSDNIEINKIYSGTVKRIMDFGAFVEILPGKEGLAHISKLSHQRIDKVTDVLKEGQKIPVKLIEIDKTGRLNLSYIDALE